MTPSDWIIANPESSGLGSEPLRDLVDWLDGFGQANIHSVKRDRASLTRVSVEATHRALAPDLGQPTDEAIDVSVGMLRSARPEVADAGQGAGDESRRPRRRKEEAGRAAPEEVDQRCQSGDIAAHHAKRLTQRSVDGGQPLRDALAFGDPTAARAVHADRVARPILR